jgi:hypothetical protein
MNCHFCGNSEFVKTDGGSLKEVHPCKNKKIECIFCETAIKYGLCKGNLEGTMPAASGGLLK